MVSRPSTPVKRPIRGPLSVSTEQLSSVQVTAKSPASPLNPDNAANEREPFPWRNFADFVAGGDEALRFGQLCAAIVMNCDERLAFFYAVTDAFVKFEADGVVNGVFLFFAAAAEGGESGAKLFAICGGEEAGGGAEDVGAGLGLREEFGVVDDPLVAALQANALLEFFPGLAGGDHGFGEEAAFVYGLGAVAEEKHPSGQFEAQFAEVGGAAAAENVDTLDDFIRMASHAAEG